MTCAVKTRWFHLEEYSYDKYVREYNKQYSPEEYQYRKQIFETRLNSIKKHNRDPTKTWKRGINQMSDWEDKQFSKLLGYKKSLAYIQKEKKMQVDQTIPNIRALPVRVDWREKRVVTAVKDQGECGSCWTFATAETIESQWAIATNGDLSDLSEQQILDCTPNPNNCGGTGGCGGGTAELAYAQVMQNGGIATEWTYPYMSYTGTNFQCHFNINGTAPDAVVQLSGYKVLPSNKYEPLLAAVATVGPIAVTVDASAWSDYESGVFDGCNQTNPDLDHAVQLVGYGTDNNLGDYWLVRNSWAPLWGEQGYIRIRRTQTLRCGVDINPSDGTGCNGGPTKVTVCGTCGILYDSSYPIIST